MAIILIQLVQVIGNLLVILIIADSLLSFFMPPTQPIREALGRILNPIYAPFRRLIPAMGGFDITPLIVLILVQILESVLINLLSRMI